MGREGDGSVSQRPVEPDARASALKSSRPLTRPLCLHPGIQLPQGSGDPKPQSLHHSQASYLFNGFWNLLNISTSALF